MYHNPQDLNDNNRVWIYQADKELTQEQVKDISILAKDFVESWTAHKQDLKASFQVLYNRFFILMADQETTGASGCSIDKSVHFVHELEKKFNVNFMNRLQVAYKRDGKIHVLPKNRFEEELLTGSIDENTIVFNNLVLTKKELETAWEVEVRHSWHKTMLT